MTESTTLTIITEAEKSLQAAADIHEMLDLRDKAMAYSVLADAKGFRDAAQKAKIFQLKAERKAGDWLKENVKPGNPEFNNSNGDTLSQLGVHKKESSRWQLQASVPEEKFEAWAEQSLESGKEITASGLRRLAREVQREERVAEDVQAALSIEDKGKLWELHNADIATFDLPENSIDAVITDPPYPEEYLDLYESLGSLAAHSLKDGGSLLALVGQAHLPEVMNILSEYLDYHWTMALSMSGPHMQLYQLKIANIWKPILWYTKGKYSGQSVRDLIDAGGMEKERFKWQQGEGGFAKLVQDFTRPGETVLDPLCGTGTTGIAAVKLGRRFVGVDIDEERIATAKVRLNDTTAKR